MAPKARYIISSKDLQLLHDITARSAQRKMQQCRDALSKTRLAPVTIAEYSKWEGLPLPEVLNILNIKDYPVQ